MREKSIVIISFDFSICATATFFVLKEQPLCRGVSDDALFKDVTRLYLMLHADHEAAAGSGFLRMETSEMPSSTSLESATQTNHSYLAVGWPLSYFAFYIF